MKAQSILLVGIGGAIGTLLRYSLFILLPINSMIATIVCNIIGSFLLAALYSYFTHKKRDIHNQKKYLHKYETYKQFFGIGLLGSFTTFSTISLDTHKLSLLSNSVAFFTYLFVTFVGGLIATAIGYELTKKRLLRCETT